MVRRRRNQNEYSVRVFFDERSSGLLSGPFASRDAAEECAMEYASRDGVLRVVIEESEDE